MSMDSAMAHTLLTPAALGNHLQILVGFSGGLDSTVLLHQLVLLREHSPDLRLRAVHVHHGLSQHADEWVSHCQRQCEQWQVPLIVQRVTVPSRGDGLEAAAREVRYRAFLQTRQPDEILATAQHQDDQCETLLLALKRGSGPAGLAAMPGERLFAGMRQIRPLLNYTREQLEACARYWQLAWIEDDSNADDRYDRNFLRLRVLPLLQQRWPHFTRAASRSAQLCAEQEQLLDELLEEELTALMSGQGALLIQPMTGMSAPRRAALLRRWIARVGGDMPSREQLQRIWQEVALSREDANPRLTLGQWEIRRYQGALWRIRTIAPPDSVCIAWPVPNSTLTLPGEAGMLQWASGGQAVRPPEDNEPVSVRFNAPGLHHIVGRHKGRALKKLWQELGIPPWLRGTIPLLFYGEKLIAAAGVFVTKEGEAQGEAWYLDWRRK